MIAYVAGGLAGMALLGGLALWVALQVNSVAVLDLVDRASGGARGTQMVAREQLGEAETQTVALYRASASGDRLPVVLFVHGGSWNWGNPDDYAFVGRSFAPEGFLVALSGYRLGQEGRHPAMLEDTARALAWVHENAAAHGGDPGRIYLAGHSAGAYNVVQVALEERWLAEAGVPRTALRGVIGLAGPYDFFPFDSDSTRAAFGEARDPEATQPVNHVTADAPPMLLATGTQDETVKPRNTRALAAALEAAGVPVEARFYEGLDHSDILLRLASPWRRDPEVRRDILDLIAATGKASVPVQGKNR